MVAGAAVAAAAVPFVVTQTIPVAMVVTPPPEGGWAPAAVDTDGERGGGRDQGGPGGAAGAGGDAIGVNLGVLNLACVLPQLLDTAYPSDPS